jgi:hypothetical protein
MRFTPNRIITDGYIQNIDLATELNYRKLQTWFEVTLALLKIRER